MAQPSRALARGMTRALIPAFLFAAAGSARTALAGGSAENAVLIINPSSLESMYFGAYYKNKRNIPDSNVLYMDPGATNYAVWSGAGGNLDGFLGFMANAHIDDHTDFVIVTPGSTFFVPASGYINDACSAVNRFSIASVFAMAYLKGDILGTPKKNSQYANGYYSVAAAPVAFDSNTAWVNGAPSTGVAARRYYIGALLCYTGNGTSNTLPEVTAMIDRSAAADGTHPAGTFYFMNNTADSVRNVRQPEYGAAMTAITGAGGVSSQITGTLPLTHFDCLGIMSGFATDNVDGGNFGILPGAYCDHLTSWAATFDNGSQTKVASWIRKGASGSFGEVEEPCNYTGKFPNAKVHSNYLLGMTAGEACFRALQYVPFQGLFYGDPLTRPFAHIPAVSLSGIPGGTASGYVTLTPSAVNDPGFTTASFDLFVDGRLMAQTSPGGSFTLDTTLLEDGWHDVRVLAYDTTAIRTSGRFVGAITTNNYGYSATLAIPGGTGLLSDSFEFDVGSPGPGVAEARVLVNDRVVSAGAEAGAQFLRGMAVGPGTHSAQAEVIFSDGHSARSPRVSFSVTYAANPPAGQPPVAFSYTRHISRAGPALVELPASFDNDPSGATYAVLSNPANATVGTSTTRAYRVVTPVASPCGTDTLTFNVTTASGTSNTATVTLIYDRPYATCPADFNGDGFVNGDDFDAFSAAFANGDISADFNNDCFTNGDDFDEFSLRFDRGC